jgi:tetratricopeptide (TPR) repeat protein
MCYHVSMIPREHVAAALQAAFAAHQQGNLAVAQSTYRDVLATFPDHPDALHLLGVTYLQSGDPGQAAPLLEKAVRQLNRADALGHLAQAYFALARYAEAHESFRKAARLDPQEVQYPIGSATALALQKKYAEAERLLAKLAQRFPREVLVWFNLGNTQRDQARHAEAAASFARALELDPQSVDARNNLGGAYHALQRFEDAEREFRACLAQAPDYPLARCNLASLLIDVGRFTEAEQLCREVIAVHPELAQAHTFLGAAVGHQGRLEDALACHRRAAALDDHDPKVLENLAGLLVDTGHFAEGVMRYATLAERGPLSLPAHMTLAGALLSRGRLDAGWAEYSHRPSLGHFRGKYPKVILTRTLPAALAGKRINLAREQGLGDEIFFLRYAPALHAAGAQLTYRAGNKVGSLLARAACFGEILDEHAPLPAADFHVLVGDLPYAYAAQALGAAPACDLPALAKQLQGDPQANAVQPVTVPPPLPLTPLPARLDELRARLAIAGSPPYTGLTWRGGTPPGEQQGALWSLYKKVDPAAFGTALRAQSGTFLALQRQPAAGELETLSAALGRPLHDFTDLNEDLEGMLALLALLDEYVGVSNTNVHLRASAGRPSRVLVPCPGEWRWMHAGDTSPWFPGTRTYRQTLAGDWTGALDALARDLGA